MYLGHPHPDLFVSSYKGPLYHDNIDILSGTTHSKLKSHKAAVVINYNQYYSGNSALKEKNVNETAHCNRHQNYITIDFAMIP